MTYKKLLITALILGGCETHIATPFAEPQTFDYTAYCQDAGVAAPKNVDIESTDLTQILPNAARVIAGASDDMAQCLSTFSNGEQKFLETVKRTHTTFAKLGGFDPSEDPEILAAQTEITRHWREDQAGRNAYLSLRTDDKTGADYWAQRLSTLHSKTVDGKAKAYLENLLEHYDWIDQKRFGNKVSAHAWIIAQHADDDPEFQAEVLKRMKHYLETNDIKPANYAYLWDRVAVNTGNLQRYGTQPTWECTDGKLELQPMEDPDNVNARRAELNMNTVEQALVDMARGVCG